LGGFIIRRYKMIGIIKQIGEAFGWHPMPYANGAAVQFGSGTGPEIVWPSDPIKFAAYAKAEMAECGWLIEYPYAGRDYHDLHICLMTTGKCAKPFKYDPTNPISEAEAVLRCISDVLRSNDPRSPARR
jgi:hypothetical protein